MQAISSRDLIKRSSDTGQFNIQFNKGMSEYETFAEPGMRARVLSVSESNDTLKLKVDYSPFDEHNRACASHDYFDKNNNPTLTGYEAGYYRPTEFIHLELNQDLSGYVTILDSQAATIYQEYVDSGASCSYIEWLESQLLASRAAVTA